MLRVATIETMRHHIAYFAGFNPGLRPEDLTAEYALACPATKAWMPETRPMM